MNEARGIRTSLWHFQDNWRNAKKLHKPYENAQMRKRPTERRLVWSTRCDCERFSDQWGKHVSRHPACYCARFFTEAPSIAIETDKPTALRMCNNSDGASTPCRGARVWRMDNCIIIVHCLLHCRIHCLRYCPIHCRIGQHCQIHCLMNCPYCPRPFLLHCIIQCLMQCLITCLIGSPLHSRIHCLIHCLIHVLMHCLCIV